MLALVPKFIVHIFKPRGGDCQGIVRSKLKWIRPIFASCHTVVNSEYFARILFSRVALKDIFATFKMRDLDIIYQHQ